MPQARTSVVVAVDISSSAVRATGYDGGYGVRASTSVPLSTATVPPGAATQSWRQLLDSVVTTVRTVAAEPGIDVAAIVLSGTASSLATAMWDRDGRPDVADPVLLWADSRAAGAGSGGAAAAYPRTLCPPHVSYWPDKLGWLAQDVAVLPQCLGGAKDFVFEVLTGRWWTDPMTAAATGVFDSAAWRWDGDLLETSGVHRDQLPAVHDATRSAPLHANAATLLRVRGGTPVVLGGMDGPLAQLGAAGFSTDIATCTAGTSIAYRRGVRSRTVDPGARLWCYPVTQDFWVLGGAGSNGGNVLVWLAGLFGWDAVGDLLGRALDIRPNVGLLFLPYLYGERSPLWRDDLRGGVVGLAPHHTAVDIARAAVDGIAAALYELASTIAERADHPVEVRLTGGFLRQPRWAQLVADALGASTTVLGTYEATAMGAAMLGWMSLGYPPPTVRPGLSVSTRYTPDPTVHTVLCAKADRISVLRDAIYPPGPERLSL